MAGFTGNDYDVIRQGIRSSAPIVVELLMRKIFGVGRVLDVGCGEGWWAAEFERWGCEVAGLDAGTAAESPLGDRRHSWDLVEFPWPDLGEFDLVICLEVLEHLPPADAARAVAALCERAPIVVYSAAIPGQGGNGHVNEQWPGYWAALFEQHGFEVSGALRWDLWDDDRVENWYRQNLMVATRNPARLPEIFSTPLAAPKALVHPVLFNHVSALRKGRRR